MSTEEIQPDYLQRGSLIGPYRIVDRLGKGGFGSAYRVERDGKQYALKVLLAQHDASGRQENLSRIKREFGLLQLIDHPRIIKVHAFEMLGSLEKGWPYIVMDLVEGARLHDWADRSKPSLSAICRAAGQVADALAAIHKRGLFHRDVKSENIIVSPSGDATLIDFGIARTRAAYTLTAAQVLIGTLTHFSPEYVLHTLDAAEGEKQPFPFYAHADAYALGIALYEVVTGRAPFAMRRPSGTPADDAAMLTTIVRDPPLRPRDANPDLPSELDELLLELLDKDPHARLMGTDLVERLEALAARTDERWTAPFSLRPASQSTVAGRRLPHVPAPSAEPAVALASSMEGYVSSPVPAVLGERDQVVTDQELARDPVTGLPPAPAVSAAMPLPAGLQDGLPEAPMVSAAMPLPVGASAALPVSALVVPPSAADRPSAVAPAPFQDPMPSAPAGAAPQGIPPLPTALRKLQEQLAPQPTKKLGAVELGMAGLLLVLLGLVAVQATLGSKPKGEELVDKYAKAAPAPVPTPAAVAAPSLVPPPAPARPDAGEPNRGGAPSVDQLSGHWTVPAPSQPVPVVPGAIPGAVPVPGSREARTAEARQIDQMLADQYGRPRVPGPGEPVGGPAMAAAPAKPAGPSPFAQVVVVGGAAAASGPRVLGIGTGERIHARLSINLDSRTVGSGPVEASTTAPVSVHGVTVLPARTRLYGRASTSGQRFNIAFSRLRLPDGTELELQALALDRRDAKPGLPASRSIAGTAPSGPNVVAEVAKGAASTAVAATQLGGGTAEVVAKQAAQGAIASGNTSATGGENVTLLDAPYEFDVFVEKPF